MALREEIPGLTAISLRDRDEEEVNTVGPNLEDKSQTPVEGFDMRKWRRRHIESYLLGPKSLVATTGKSEEEIREHLQQVHALVVNDAYFKRDCPDTMLEIRGKAILSGLKVTAGEVAEHLSPEEACEDLKLLVSLLAIDSVGG